MKHEEKKAAVAAYKERRISAGVFSVACAATGQRWVGGAPNLHTIQNRLWFTLRQGSCPHPTLQAAWRTHGPETFAFEIVETLDEETLGYVRDSAMKDRVAHWRIELQAEAI